MYRITQITDSYWWEEASCDKLVFTRDARNRESEKTSGQIHLFNIWTIGAMDRTSGQPQVKTEPIITQYFFENSTTVLSRPAFCTILKTKQGHCMGLCLELHCKKS